MPYIYSTLSNDQVYPTYKKSPNGLNVAESEIFVAGKANITTKHFVTPSGMATEVSDEQIAQLRTNPVFKRHEANGFLKIENRKADTDKVTSDMTGRDESAPLTENDFGEEDAPTTNKRGRKGRG